MAKIDLSQFEFIERPFWGTRKAPTVKIYKNGIIRFSAALCADFTETTVDFALSSDRAQLLIRLPGAFRISKNKKDTGKKSLVKTLSNKLIEAGIILPAEYKMERIDETTWVGTLQR